LNRPTFQPSLPKRIRLIRQFHSPSVMLVGCVHFEPIFLSGASIPRYYLAIARKSHFERTGLFQLLVDSTAHGQT